MEGFFKTVAAIYAVVAVGAVLVRGENCEDLKGFWYNNLGSEMLLDHTEDGLLTGEYRTAVERSAGAAGTSHSKLIGAAPYDKPGSTFGFSVSWRGGRSTTAWTAQCLVCGGDEVIFTTWLLRTQVTACIDKWKSVYIGQDVFTRHDKVHGPRKNLGTHTPSDANPDDESRRKRDLGGRTQRFKRQTDNKSRTPCSLEGVWYNQIGSKVVLREGDDNILKGEYHTAREVREGDLRGLHSGVHGIGNSDILNDTFAMFLIWEQGASVTGWVGQCLLCEEDNRTSEVLQMTWLHRSQADSCHANFRSTLYGENTFYQEPGRTGSAGLSDDRVREFGEVALSEQQVAAGVPSGGLGSPFLPLIVIVSTLSGLLL